MNGHSNGNGSHGHRSPPPDNKQHSHYDSNSFSSCAAVDHARGITATTTSTPSPVRPRCAGVALIVLLPIGFVICLHFIVFSKVLTPTDRQETLFENYNNHDNDNNQQVLLHARMKELETIVQELHNITQMTFHVQSPPHREQQVQQQQQALPTCREIMSRPQSPYSDGSFLMREGTSTAWIPRTDGSRELTLNVCQLHRYTAPQARECLKGEHFLAIGDSLTRYMTLSFAHFIHRGEWPARFTRENMGRGGDSSQCFHWDEAGNEACSKPNEPHLLSEGTFRYANLNNNNGKGSLFDAWERLQALVGGWTDGGIFDGHMECSCARSNQRQKCTDGSVLGCVADNLLYVSEPIPDSKADSTAAAAADSNNQELADRVLVSFVSQTGWGDSPTTVKGFNFTGCALTGTCRRDRKITKMTLDRSNKNDYDFEATLEDALQPDGIITRHWPSVPTVVMYNRGLWGQLTKAQAKTLFPLLYNFTRSSSKADRARCFFRGTTGSKRTLGLAGQERDLTRSETYEAGCTFLDLAHVTHEFSVIHPKLTSEYQNVFWDAVHYQPWVYEEVNNLLLNVLCNSKALESAS